MSHLRTPSPTDCVAATPWAHDALTLRRAGAALGAPIRLLADALVAAPALDPRLPTPPALARLLRALTGRLVVHNPTGVTRLPAPAVRLYEALARHALGLLPTSAAPADAPAPHRAARPGALTLVDARDAADRERAARVLAALDDRARAAVAPPRPGRRVRAVLHRLPDVSVAFADAHAGSAPESAGAPPAIHAALRYRLTLVLDDGGAAAHGDDAAADARADVRAERAAAEAAGVPWPPAPAAPLTWFAARLLVPDAVAARGMDPATLARWAALTGRAGEGTDSYWCAEAWARFCEPNRMVGFVTPADVGASKRGRAAAPELGAYAGAAVPSPFTPDAERGVWVPPGYCLLSCTASLEVAAAALQRA